MKILIPLLIILSSCATDPIDMDYVAHNEVVQEIDWSQYEKLEPIKKVIDGITYTVAPRGVQSAFGVICNNDQFLKIGERIGEVCICGRYGIKYWVYKKENI